MKGGPSITSSESLDFLNNQLVNSQQAAVAIDRFRPNIVISGWDKAFKEDEVTTITVGPMVFRTAKPCVRCKVINVDQLTAQTYQEPIKTLAKIRYNPKLRGPTFGVNAYLESGWGELISVGDSVSVT